MAVKLGTTGVQHQIISGAVNTVFTRTDHLAKIDRRIGPQAVVPIDVGA